MTISVWLETTPPLYLRSCSGEMSIRLGNGKSLRDETPGCGGNPFYWNGGYVSNGWPDCLYACDVVQCIPADVEHGFHTGELLLREPSAGGAGAAGHSDSGGAGGAEQWDHYVSVPTRGPYEIRGTFYADSECNGPELDTGWLHVEVE